MSETLENILLDMLNAAVAEVISLDADGKQKLAALRGKTFCLEITAPPIKLYLSPTDGGVKFHRQSESPADVTLTGSVSAFARLAYGASAEQRIAVHGDAELGQALQKILAQLDLDWEELLSRYVGDTPARKLGNAAREVASWAEKSFALSRENAADYLREEKQILPTRIAVQNFVKEVNQTRADIDRLAKRIEKIKNKRD